MDKAFEPSLVIGDKITAEQLRTMERFEISLKGYDSSTDATDYLVKWVACVDRTTLNKWIEQQNISEIIQSITTMRDDYVSVEFGEGLDAAIMTVDRYSLYSHEDTTDVWWRDSQTALRIQYIENQVKLFAAGLEQPVRKSGEKYADRNTHTTSQVARGKAYVVHHLGSSGTSVQAIEKLLNEGWIVEHLSHPTIILSKPRYSDG